MTTTTKSRCLGRNGGKAKNPVEQPFPGIRIRKRLNRSGGAFSWRVEVGARLTGHRRTVKQFPSREEADTYARAMHDQKERSGTNAFLLSDAARADAARALETLASLGVSLTEAAEFYTQHARPPAGHISIQALIDELIEFKENRQRMRPRYLQDLRSRLGMFAKTFGSRTITSVTSQEIDTWLYADQTIGEQTRDNNYRALSVLFHFACGRRDKRGFTASAYRSDNPLLAVPRPTIDREPPVILKPEQAEALLAAAISEEGRGLGLLPWVVLGLFCGLRSTELMQLKWGDVRLSAGWVTVSARIAKKRRLRNVPIPANAGEWLATCSGAPDDPIAPPGAEDRLARLGKFAGIDPWPTNCLRHSFGSYDFAFSDNAAATAAKLGHKNDDILFEHYRALTDKSEAERFFNIVPAEDVDTMVRFQATQ